MGTSCTSKWRRGVRGKLYRRLAPVGGAVGGGEGGGGGGEVGGGSS